MEQKNPTKFCRHCGEKGIDSRILTSLKTEADQVNLKKGGNEAANESMNTLDAIEKFRRGLMNLQEGKSAKLG